MSQQETNPADFELDGDIAKQLKRNDAGLVPAIAQSERGEVLMMAWMDDHALAHTLVPERPRITRVRARNTGLRD